MKEVKGLGDRLFGLEQLLVGAKKYLQEQAEMAQVGYKNLKSDWIKNMDASFLAKH